MTHPVIDLVPTDLGDLTALADLRRPRVPEQPLRPGRAEHARVSVIAPSRNEQDNVAPLAAALSGAFGDEWTWELVFADDSDDGTPAAVRALAAAGRPVRLAHRERHQRAGGLGGAILHALPMASHPTVVVMDADLQHPAAVVPALARAVSLGTTDIAIGSRFCAGGSSGDGLDGPLRRLSSELSRAGTRALLPRVRRVRDPLSGFFAVRRDLLDGAGLQPDGYKILLEVLARTPWESLLEVPIEFRPRVAGTSKFGAAEVRTFLRHLRALRAVAG